MDVDICEYCKKKESCEEREERKERKKGGEVVIECEEFEEEGW